MIQSLNNIKRILKRVFTYILFYFYFSGINVLYHWMRLRRLKKKVLLKLISMCHGWEDVNYIVEDIIWHGSQQFCCCVYITRRAKSIMFWICIKRCDIQIEASKTLNTRKNNQELFNNRKHSREYSLTRLLTKSLCRI